MGSGSWFTHSASPGRRTTTHAAGTDNAVARYDGADAIQGSGVTLDDSDNLAGVNSLNLIATGTDNRLARYNSTNAIQDSGITVDDSDNLSGAGDYGGASVTVSGVASYSSATFSSESSTVPGGAPSAGTGKLWVRDDTPNVLVFTDDGGTDNVLGATEVDAGNDNRLARYNGSAAIQSSGITVDDSNNLSGAADYGGATVTLTGAASIASATFNTESASVPGGAPSAGEGKLWVRSDTPNVLVFTDDGGTDNVLGATEVGAGNDNRLARYNGSAAIQSSGVTVDDSDNLTGVGSITMDGTLDLSSGSGDVVLGLNQQLTLDDDADSYIVAPSDDTIEVYTLATLALTIDSSQDLLIDSGNVLLGLNQNLILDDDADSAIRCAADDQLDHLINNYVRYRISVTGGHEFTQEPGDATNDAQQLARFTGAAHANADETAEQRDVYFNLAATTTFQGGSTLAQNRSIHIAARTFVAGSAHTITDAATVYIDGAPTAGTNVTITNAWALWIDSGDIRLDGGIDMSNGSGALTMNGAITGATSINLIATGTDNRLARYDGTNGIQDSGISIDDSDNITGVTTIDVISSSSDNALARYDGTDNIQGSGISINDSDDISGVHNLSISDTDADSGAALSIARSPGSSAAAVGMDITMGANASGAAISITNNGSGPSIDAGGNIRVPQGSSVYLDGSNQGARVYSAGNNKLTLEHDLGAATSGVGVAISSASAITNASGAIAFMEVQPTINQSGTAGYRAFSVFLTETSTGSGERNAIYVYRGSKRFSVDADGDIFTDSGAINATTSMTLQTGGTTFLTGDASQDATFAATVTLDHTGSESSPSLMLNSETDTGFFGDTANEVAVSCNSTEIMRWADGLVTLTKNGVGSGDSSIGLLLVNETAADAAVSPRLVWEANDNGPREYQWGMHARTEADLSETDFRAFVVSNNDNDGGWTDILYLTDVALRPAVDGGFDLGDISASGSVFRSVFVDDSLRVSKAAESDSSPRSMLRLDEASHTSLSNGSSGYTSVLLGGGTATIEYDGSTTNAEQRFASITSPTYAAEAAMTITDAATVYIDAAPTAGTNMTITNAWALWVDAGDVRLDGDVSMTAGTIDSSTSLTLQTDSTDAITIDASQDATFAGNIFANQIDVTNNTKIVLDGHGGNTFIRANGDTGSLVAGAVNCIQWNNTSTAGETRLLVYDVDNGAMQQVTVGAADSGGSGFKVLRIPN